MKHLSERSRPDWDDIARMEPDAIPLSEEEERQLGAKEGFITGEATIIFLEYQVKSKHEKIEEELKK